MSHGDPTHPEPHRESVWDYPRPPRLEPTSRHLRVIHGGRQLAATHHGMRLLETSHPPVYYFPPADIDLERLQPHPARSLCEYKGVAQYLALKSDPEQAVAWLYSEPSPRYLALREYVAFYPGRFDQCWVDDHRVAPQAGDFYGGWITPELEGPFKGGPGTLGW